MSNLNSYATRPSQKNNSRENTQLDQRQKPSPDVLARYSQQVRMTNTRNKESKDQLNKYRKSTSKANGDKLLKSQMMGQFKKYISSTENVFYEDRKDLKFIRWIDLVLKFLIPLWFLLAGSYALLSRIDPYKGPCPSNADCGVFIHCHKGYILKDG